ncbi:hypothetical protein KAI87_01010 [Myxococcota bacterium]|nr:hypothetical protein [Myxococcota bacterium]
MNGGALRWTAGVDPTRGVVADHDLIPMGETPEMTKKQRLCLLQVLSNPTYRLKAPENQPPATPARVGIVIEF